MTWFTDSNGDEGGIMDQQGLPLPHHLSHIQLHLTHHHSTSPPGQLQHLLAWRIFDNILDNKHVQLRNAKGFITYIYKPCNEIFTRYRMSPYFQLSNSTLPLITILMSWWYEKLTYCRCVEVELNVKMRWILCKSWVSKSPSLSLEEEFQEIISINLCIIRECDTSNFHFRMQVATIYVA